MTPAPLRRALLLVAAAHLLLWPLVAAEVNLLLFGDWGYSGSGSKQRDVAEQIVEYARKQRVQFDAALLAGDNFYSELKDGADDKRWRSQFEEMYDRRALPMSFYASIGNHDYSKRKVQAQFEYARQNPSSRWKLPAKWYAVDFPTNKPLVTVLVLDSNSGRLSSEERKKQIQWLETQLTDPANGSWTIAVAHHPLFSNGRHGDTPTLIEDWGRLFRKHRLDFYLCGHDHTLQHLEVENWPISFMVSGGGGAKLQDIRRDDRGPFFRALHGFVHLQFTPKQATVKFICVEGKVVHEFTRSATGTVNVLQTTPSDPPTRREEDNDKDDDDDGG